MEQSLVLSVNLRKTDSSGKAHYIKARSAAPLSKHDTMWCALSGPDDAVGRGVLCVGERACP